MYSLIFKNDDFVIINKFHNIDFHGDEGIVSKLRAFYPSIYGIHRLDKGTSGLMVFALNKDTQSKLSKQFEVKTIQKTYFALTDMKAKKKQGTVKGDMEKGRGGNYFLRRTMQNPSHTKFQSYFLPNSELRLFKLLPFTGKTHQLRVVMKNLGCPILGDKRYGGNPELRMHLYAVRLKFTYNEEDYCFDISKTLTDSSLFNEGDLEIFTEICENL